MLSNFLVLCGLVLLGVILGAFGIWTYTIARSMKRGLAKQGVVNQLESLSDSLKIPLVTIPFAFWVFRVRCHVQNVRNADEMKALAAETYILSAVFLVTTTVAWAGAVVAYQ